MVYCSVFDRSTGKVFTSSTHGRISHFPLLTGTSHDRPVRLIAAGAVVLGDVHLGRDVSVWYNAVPCRGDTERIEVGEGTNVQDLSVVHSDPGVPCVVGTAV